jgi:thioredoxin reductase
VEWSHGYLGRDPQRPGDLRAAGRKELLAYPTASIVESTVESVTRGDGLFELDGWSAHRLVLACGVQDAFPDVAGFDEHYGASVFHCPACDGYEARDRDVVVLGWERHLVGFAATLLNWARSVTIVTNGHRFEGEAAHLGIEVLEQDAQTFLGTRGDLQGLRLGNGRELPVSLVFFSVAHRPRTDLAQQLGCQIDDDGYVEIDDCGATSVEGVYAAGDLVPGLQLVQVAAATGVVAGVAAAQSLFGTAGAPTSPQPAPAT